MLMQLHHQFEDGHTEMQSQREIENHDELRKWIRETQETHPLPVSAIWMACNEDSEHFWKAVQQGEP